MSSQTGVEKNRSRILTHVIWMLVLYGIFVWPGAMLFNRIEPKILGIPLYVFMVWVVGPLLALANVVIYVRNFWPVDTAEMQKMRREEKAL